MSYGHANTGLFGDSSLDLEVQQTRLARNNNRATSPASTTTTGNAVFRRASIYNSSRDLATTALPSTEIHSRDTQDIRTNIQTLVNNGSSGNGNKNGPQSLAGMMGGSSKPPRLHRINSGIRPEEKEATDNLEKEMEISRAKWAHKRTGGTEGGSKAGVSMATIMQGRAKASSTVIPNKFEIATPSSTIPAPLSVITSSQPVSAPPTATSFPSASSPTNTSNSFKPMTSPSTQPRSIAAMMGSKESGPRLNKQSIAVTPVEEEGPSHGRSIPFPMPGMVRSTSGSVRERARSMNLGGSSPVEARAIIRKPILDPEFKETGTPTKESRNKMQGRWAQRSQSVDIKANVLVGLSGGEFKRGLRNLPIDTPTSSASPISVPKLHPVAYSSNAQPTINSISNTPILDYCPSSPEIPTIRCDPSPRFDSPPMDNSSWGLICTKRSIEETKPIDLFDSTPRPWSPSKKSTPTAKPRPLSISTKTAEDSDMDSARSPVKSVRSAIATWGNSINTSAASPIVEKPPSRRVSREWTQPNVEIESFSKPLIELTKRKNTTIYRITELQGKLELDFDGEVYETEVIAVTTASSQLLLWLGKLASINEAEIKDLEQELRCKAIRCDQGQEIQVLMNYFGKQLTIRLGLRDSFLESDSRLYTVREEVTGLFIEEAQLESTSICSRLCVVLTLVDSIYLWSGKFSNSIEFQGAREFALKNQNGRSIKQFSEGREDDLFWTVLGGMNYASANHWRYRSNYISSVYGITHRSELLDLPIIPVDKISLIDTGVEHYILVPAKFRNDKIKIKLALSTSERLAKDWKLKQLSFRPPSHVLFFPTIIPNDLKFVDRSIISGLDYLNGGSTTKILDLFTFEEVCELLL